MYVWLCPLTLSAYPVDYTSNLECYRWLRLHNLNQNCTNKFLCCLSLFSHLGCYSYSFSTPPWIGSRLRWWLASICNTHRRWILRDQGWIEWNPWNQKLYVFYCWSMRFWQPSRTSPHHFTWILEWTLWILSWHRFWPFVTATYYYVRSAYTAYFMLELYYIMVIDMAHKCYKSIYKYVYENIQNSPKLIGMLVFS